MRLNESLNLVEVFRTPLCRAIAGHLMLLVVYLWSRTDGVPKYLNLLEHEMNRFKDLLLVSLGFTAIVLVPPAISVKRERLSRPRQTSVPVVVEIDMAACRLFSHLELE